MIILKSMLLGKKYACSHMAPKHFNKHVALLLEQATGLEAPLNTLQEKYFLGI